MFCRNKVPTAYFMFCFMHLNHKKKEKKQVAIIWFTGSDDTISIEVAAHNFFVRFRTNSPSRTENEQNAAKYCHAFQAKISTSRSTQIYRDVCRHYSIGLKIHPHNFPISNFLSVFLWIGLKNMYAFFLKLSCDVTSQLT